MLRDLKLATIFLTRLPVPLRGDVATHDLARTVHLFPLVGAGVGLAGGLAYALMTAAGLAPLPCAALALTAMVGLTGALHEDGLADTADAFATADRARALAIMRDSRIGAFGAMALILSVVLKVAAIADMDGPWRVAGALAGAAAFSRALLPAVMLVQPSARAGGLAAAVGRTDGWRTSLSLGLGAVVTLAALPGPEALVCMAVAAAIAAAMAAVLGRRFGGCTGDTLGATQQVAEVTFLLATGVRL